MWLGVLGPLRVQHEDAEIVVPAAKQRVVLATLLMHANQVVSTGQLLEALWGETGPARADVTLRNYVKRLRQVLGPAGAKIRTHSPGYQIDVGEHELDVLQFTRLSAVAGAAVRQQSWAAAQQALDAALTLWRGAPLADIPSEVLWRDAVPPLEQLHLQAVEWCLEARLHLGGHAELVPQLRSLAAAQPAREHWHALLMLALYRCGRQAEALAAYQNARRLLVGDLGVEPGAELRDLHQHILAGDPQLMGPQATGSPLTGPPLTGPQPVAAPLAAPQAAAAGHREPGQAGLSGATGQPPGAVGQPPGAAGQPAAGGPPRQLPPGTRYFSGRLAALAQLTELLGQRDDTGGTVVTAVVSGSAGVGKTALALHWAHRVAGRFPDGQLYVNLRGFDPRGTPVPPAAAIRGFLDALGVPSAELPASPQAQAGLYRSLLADRGLLILLDNARDAEQVRPLLPTGRGCLVLITSRSQLTGLVATDGAHPVRLGLPTEAEAAGLLTRRLGPAGAAQEPAAVAGLVQLCARLPLALSIAAARAATRPGLSLAGLAAELREAGLDALATGEAATDVRAVFSWSCRWLSPAAARLFRLLGTQLGPDISVAAAASLAAVTPVVARQALAELAEAHLADEHLPGRYTQHDLLRSYAAELASQHERPAGLDAAARRLLDHYLHTACRADRLLYPARDSIAVPDSLPGITPEELADHRAAWEWFSAGRQVLAAAAGYAADRDVYPHAWLLPRALATYLDRRGRWQDSADLQETALAAAQRAGDLHGQAEACRILATACLMLGDPGRSEPLYHQAMALFGRAGDRGGQARGALDIVRVLAHRGSHEAALEYAQQAFRLFRATGNGAGQARALSSIGWQHAQLGQAAAALACCGQALELLRELGDQLGQAATWDSLGSIHRHLGDLDQAVTCYQQAADLCTALGATYYQAGTLGRLGDLHATAGDPAAARAAWSRALVILDEPQHPQARWLRARLAALDAPAT